LKEQKIDSYISATERLAVIGSPSSTSKLTLDILGSAIARKLVGELALLQYVQDGSLIMLLDKLRRLSCVISGMKIPLCAV